MTLLAETSFTHLDRDLPVKAAPGYGRNNNASLDSLSLMYGGQITSYLGAFAEVNFDGVDKKIHMQEFDIRHVDEAKLLGRDIVIGVDINNRPSTQDIWQTHPSWGFPFQESDLVPGPAAAPFLEIALDRNVLGLGVYAMWNDWLYLEMTGYRGLDRNFLRNVNIAPVNGGDTLSGIVPYWRAALQHEFAEGQHYIQLGTYGITASVYPGGSKLTGLTDHYVDVGVDTTYQWIADVTDTTSSVLFLHASVLRETADLNASRSIAHTNPTDQLTAARAELSYSFGATLTPTVQYFHIDGTGDAARWNTSAGSPNSAGWAAELAYVPWGKPPSDQHWFNLRLLSRYTAYSQFDGLRNGASGHDNLFLGATLVVGLNR